MSLKKNAALTAIFLLSSTYADLPLGIIGGDDTTGTVPGYAALISTSGVATPLILNLTNGSIEGVAINSSGQGLIGGSNTPATAGYAAHVSPSGVVTPITTDLPPIGAILSVAINNSGQGIMAGRDNAGTQYAALVSPSGTTTPISTGLPAGNGQISSASLNESGQGLIGGTNNMTSSPYAAIVSPSGTATAISTGLLAGGIFTTAINAGGQGLIGGNAGTPAYAAMVSPAGIATPLAPLPIDGFIASVAINDAGQGIIGGGGNGPVFPFYAALVSPSGVVTPLTGFPASGQIDSVAINADGKGLIGGIEFIGLLGPSFVAFVSPSGVLTPISTTPVNGEIVSVAINEFGQGLIGGIDFDSGVSYAAIISSNGIATEIPLGSPMGGIISVAMVIQTVTPMLNKIPTDSLSGNNLAFAKYINKNAPQDAFYFVPSVFDGTLAEALESAAPTRNAFSLYTASNNLFYLTNGLSNHIRNRSHTQSHNQSRYIRNAAQTSMASAADDWSTEGVLVSESEGWQPDDLTVSMRIHQPKTKDKACEKPCESAKKPNEPCKPPVKAVCKPPVKKVCKPPVKKVRECPEENSNSIWFEAIGALAYQKEQHQTPGFHPTSGGAILAYDGKISDHIRMGLGASYLYTHIHEKERAGNSHINQEDLFVYGSWENRQFYVDGSLLGGLFQTEQVRKIHMTGFEFQSKSKPHGWQLLPHAELGYHYTRPNGAELTVNPFIMIDWANAWQNHYHEKGSGPFNAGQKSHYSSLLRTEASVRFYETVCFDNGNLTFQEKVGYVNVHSFGTGRVNAFLVGSPGSFTVTTLTGDQNLGVVEFALIFAPHESNFTGTVFYQGEFGSNYKSHQGVLEFNWNF